MKKIISLLILFFAFGSYNAQTLTPVSGLATNSYVAKMNNNINSSFTDLGTDADSLKWANKVYMASITFTSANTGVVYANNRTINSSTATTSTVESYSISIPNGKYYVTGLNAAVSSTAIGSFDAWFFSEPVYSEGDNRSVNGLSTSDMMKNVGMCKADGTWSTASSVQISTGKAGGYSGVNIPFLVTVTEGKLNIVFIARAAWTPSPSSVYTIIFYLERKL